MKRFAMLLLPLLIAALAFGASDVRKAKLAEERAVARTGASVGLESTNAGWLRITPEPSGHDYRGITLSPAGAIWVTGFNTSNTLDYVWRSDNGGATWTKKQVLKGEGITEVAVVNETTAVFGSFDGKLYRTSNTGATWDSVWAYAPDTGWVNGVRTIGVDSLIAIGDADAQGLMVARSFDGGKNWTRVTNLPVALQEASAYASYSTYRQAIDVFGKTIWIGAYYGSTRNFRIVKSTDGGDTWTTWEIALTGGTAQNYYLRSINFMDDSLGFGADRQIASGSDHWLHKTTDGGMVWSDTLNVEPAVPHVNAKVRSAKPIRGTNTVVAVGWNNTGTVSKAWISTDKGVSWTAMHPGTTGILTNSAWRSATEGYVVGNNVVLKYSPKNVRAVTFMLNTATVPDTIPVAGSTIQMRGGVNHAGGFSPITWGSEAQNNMTNVGGDYWKKTVYMQVGDTLRYKYVVAYATGTGWEGGVVPADYPAATNDNRSLVVPDMDTTVNVEFWNNGAGTRAQYFRPYPAAADSFFTVYFRVNMNGVISGGTYGYDGDVDTIAVRGGGSAGSDLDWGRSSYMVREVPASNGDGYTSPANSFWSVGLKINKNGLTEGATVGFKYLIGSDWNRPNGTKADEAVDRNFKVPVGFRDTTLAWVYFNNEKPVARLNPDTIKITFRANLAQAASSGGFNVTTDTLYVRTGYFNTTNESGRGKMMVRLSGTIFQAVDTIITAKKKLMDYQYYTVRDGQEIRETYYNFFYTGPVPSEAERRQVLIDSTVSVASGQTVLDTATSITVARRQPVFPNGRKLARVVNVKWEVDLRPAYYQVKLGGDSLSDIQGTYTIRVGQQDSIMSWGVWINGPAAGGWSNDGGDWGLSLANNLAKKLYDNGTNGDRVAGDSIFTRQILASPDSVAIGTKDRVGQTFKFGIRGGDNEGGRGGFGNNHNENIVDTDTVYTLSSQWGSINPAFYDAWDYDLRKPKTPTSVIDADKPLVYELAQNYPNPFNPTTKIDYSIPLQSQVELKIYNVVGQEVATLVNEVQKSGIHSAKFNASNLASGIYFYRLVAGNFVSVKKMVLVK